MGRKCKADKPLNAMIPGIRATDEELQGLKDEAAEQGMSLTSYLRILIFRDTQRRKLKKLQFVDTQVLADLAKDHIKLVADTRLDDGDRDVYVCHLLLMYREHLAAPALSATYALFFLEPA